jgi:hypothetical protein
MSGGPADGRRLTDTEAAALMLGRQGVDGLAGDELEEIAATAARLQRELGALRARLPQPGWEEGEWGS